MNEKRVAAFKKEFAKYALAPSLMRQLWGHFGPRGSMTFGQASLHISMQDETGKGITQSFEQLRIMEGDKRMRDTLRKMFKPMIEGFKSDTVTAKAAPAAPTLG